jgi:ABC-type multidrug transport system fused ATPase/permease subunit
VNLENTYNIYATRLVSIDGEDVASYSMSYLRSCIAVVAQEPVLFSGTVLENILYGISRNISPKEVLSLACLAFLHI